MKKLFATIIAVFAITFAPLTPVAAVDVFNNCNGAAADTTICKAAKNDKLFGAGGLWNRILSTFTFIIGAIAVLMIIIGALRYVLSAGDATALTSAKNTILYAAVGLVIAAMANAIVNFVLTNI
ncbi:MAG TPA: hypothetical protein VM581_00850 [Magnetospirillaceae bacterium]|nr:hypothetical protein [Magnetospirillaceae bacterium]